MSLQRSLRLDPDVATETIARCLPDVARQEAVVHLARLIARTAKAGSPAQQKKEAFDETSAR